MWEIFPWSTTGCLRLVDSDVHDRPAGRCRRIGLLGDEKSGLNVEIPYLNP
jgi:hypothetical protein